MQATPKPQTDQALLEAIVAQVVAHARPRRIYLFGSRARGTAAPYADYDIAMEGGVGDHRTLRRLKDALDATGGAYVVELIDLDNCEERFAEHVRSEGVVLHDET
jgi:uncharacterized protein